MKRLTLLMATILGASTMSGCAWLNPGEEEFACSGMPGSVFCHSARDVYEKTNSGLVPSPINGNTYNKDCKDCVRAEDENPDLYADDEARKEESKASSIASTTRGHNGSTGKTLDVTNDEIINNYVTPYLPNRPVPVRTPAQIMRIWVGPYVDSNGDLVAPGIVYTEIEPRKWIYPGQTTADGSTNDRVMRPLASRSEYAGGSTSGLGQQTQSDGEFSALQRFGRNQQTLKKRVSN